ncbi:MAG: FGGY-family carbohydrate kinase [Sphaerochaeta sp.]
MNNDIRIELEKGDCSLGIEFGSTRIKAIIVDSHNNVIAHGNYDWENINIEGIWCYEIDEIIKGMQQCYRTLKESVKTEYGLTLHTFKSMGVSAMMHGIIAVDKDNQLLTPFRTWRNNITASESEELTELFDYPIPQRWTIAHLYKIIKEGVDLTSLDYVSTLSGYIHRLLTNTKTIGIGDASGMFPIEGINYKEDSINKFDKIIKANNYDFSIKDIFPKVLVCSNFAGSLTKDGALLLDSSGELVEGIPFCPPEGDAETGMVATNSVSPRCGNVSAGTSVFSMVVLEKPLSKKYDKLDLVTTPEGNSVAMAHSNNCTSEYDSWISLFQEMINDLHINITTPELYNYVLNKALDGSKDCNGVLSYPYVSGEHGTGFSEGRPMVIKNGIKNFNLSNFMRSQLFSSLCAMRVGLDILFEDEDVVIDKIVGHGGFFKTMNVGGLIMSAATHNKVEVLDDAGEGGAFGIAILASYVVNKKENQDLGEFLNSEVFGNTKSHTFMAGKDDIEGFNRFYKNYMKGLEIEKAAIKYY